MRTNTIIALLLVALGVWGMFGGTPSPGPGPEPHPNPKPDPPPVIEKLYVLFLYESDDVDDDRWLANILTSQKIRRMASSKLVLKFADDDEKDERGNVPPSTKPWIEHARQQNWKLPHVIMADQDGNLVHHGMVPRTVDEVVELIGRYGP